MGWDFVSHCQDLYLTYIYVYKYDINSMYLIMRWRGSNNIYLWNQSKICKHVLFTR